MKTRVGNWRPSPSLSLALFRPKCYNKGNRPPGLGFGGGGFSIFWPGCRPFITGGTCFAYWNRHRLHHRQGGGAGRQRPDHIQNLRAAHVQGAGEDRRDAGAADRYPGRAGGTGGDHRLRRPGGGKRLRHRLRSGGFCHRGGGGAIHPRHRRGGGAGRRGCQNHFLDRRAGGADERLLRRGHRGLYRPDGHPAEHHRRRAGRAQPPA